MKKLFTILLLGLAIGAHAQALTGGAGLSGGASLSAVAAGGGGSFQFLETFDNATDFDNVGWTKNNGTENPNGTALEGTEGCVLSASNDYIEHAQTAQDTTYYHFLFRCNSLASFVEPLWIRNSGTGLIGRVGINVTTGTVYGEHGSVYTANTVSTVAINTTYHFWVTFTKGTGANGAMSVAFSTSGTRPTSGNDFTSLSNGDATVQPDSVRLRNDSTTQVILDRFIINNSQIGDNP